MTCHRPKRPLPRIWLFTDPRIDACLEGAVQRLPAGSGVILRHYDLPEAERRALFRRLARIARRRGHVILIAAKPATARRWGADGCHGNICARRDPGVLIVSHPVHCPGEIAAAHRARADLVFLSPVHRTASHPADRPLGMTQFGRLARLAHMPVYALGGMNARRAAMIRRICAGWGAIDGHNRTVRWHKRHSGKATQADDQKRISVPT